MKKWTSETRDFWRRKLAGYSSVAADCTMDAKTISCSIALAFLCFPIFVKSRSFAENTSRSVWNLNFSGNYWRVTLSRILLNFAGESRRKVWVTSGKTNPSKTYKIVARRKIERLRYSSGWGRTNEKEAERKNNKATIKSYRTAPRDVRRYHLRGLHASPVLIPLPRYGPPLFRGFK